MEQKLKATEEQVAYAWLLDKGMKAGLVILTITFFIYMTGMLEHHVPVNKLPEYWGLSVHKYLELAQIQPGWWWLRMVHKGDFLNFIGIAFLAGITLVCYVRIIPILLKKKDRVFTLIGLLEVLVLALAASGLLKTGGH